MSTPRILVIVAVALCSALTSFAQPGGSTKSTALDGPFIQETNRTRMVYDWPAIREADVLWRKRVWEDIDLNQKANFPYLFPLTELAGRKSLWQLIVYGLENDKIHAWEYLFADGHTEEEFQSPNLTFQEMSEIDKMLNFIKEVTPPIYDPNDATNIIGYGDPVRTLEARNAKTIVGYRLKEDWIFDKQRSTMVCRIVGIAPLAYPSVMDASNNWVEDTSQPAQPLFWLNYDECKQLFANFDVFNTFNDSNRQTYYDYLENRRFVGRVVKEENVYNREINDYAVGVDALLEGERVRKQIFEYEHDLWNY